MFASGPKIASLCEAGISLAAVAARALCCSVANYALLQVGTRMFSYSARSQYATSWGAFVVRIDIKILITAISLHRTIRIFSRILFSASVINSISVSICMSLLFHSYALPHLNYSSNLPMCSSQSSMTRLTKNHFQFLDSIHWSQVNFHQRKSHRISPPVQFSRPKAWTLLRFWHIQQKLLGNLGLQASWPFLLEEHINICTQKRKGERYLGPHFSKTGKESYRREELGW